MLSLLVNYDLPWNLERATFSLNAVLIDRVPAEVDLTCLGFWRILVSEFIASIDSNQRNLDFTRFLRGGFHETPDFIG